MLNQTGYFSLRKNIKALLKPDEHHLRSVDGLRGLSILLVLITHVFWFLSVFDVEAPAFFYSLPDVYNWIFNGELGVDIFFVISGFLISSILMKEYKEKQRLNLLNFYRRRFMRLMPAYFLALFVGFFLLPENREYIWTNLIYINNLFAAETHFMPWTWSLAIEEQFYFVFPLLLIFLLRCRSAISFVALLGLLFVLSFALRYLAITSSQLTLPVCWYVAPCQGFFDLIDGVYVKPWARFGSFLPGIAAAYLHIFHRQQLLEFFARNKWLIKTALTASVLLVVVILFVPVNNQQASFHPGFSLAYHVSYRNVFTLAISAILLISLYGPKGEVSFVNAFLSSRILYSIGQLAYSAYLFHPFVFGGIYAALFQSALVLTFWQKIGIVFLVGMPLTFLLASLVYLFVEKPFMNMRKSERMPANSLARG